MTTSSIRLRLAGSAIAAWLALSSAPALAGVVLFTDRGEWESYVPDRQVETLDGATAGLLPPGVPTAVGLVTLTAGDGQIIGTLDKMLFAGLFGAPVQRTLRIDLPEPVEAFGVELSQAGTGAHVVATFGQDVVVVDLVPGFEGLGIGETGFFGVISDAPFDSVLFEAVPRDTFPSATPGFDDIRFGRFPVAEILLERGDILAVDTQGQGLSGVSNGSIRLVVPEPEVVTPWQGDDFENPTDIAMGADGRIYFTGLYGNGTLWELDTRTGLERVVASRDDFGATTLFGGISVAPGGDVFIVTDRGGAHVERIDPDGGDPQVMASLSPRPLTLEDVLVRPDGRTFVSGASSVEYMGFNYTVGALYELDFQEARLDLLSLGQRGGEGPPFDRDRIGSFAEGLALEADGSILVSTGAAEPWIVRYDPSDGSTEQVCDCGGHYIAVEPSGDIVYTTSGRSVLRYGIQQGSVAQAFQSPQVDSRLAGVLVLDRPIAFIPTPEPEPRLLAAATLAVLGLLRRRARALPPRLSLQG